MAWFDSNRKSGGPWEWDDVYASNAHIGLMNRKGYVLLTPEEVEAHERNEYVPQMLTNIEDVDIEAVYSTKKPKIRRADPPNHMGRGTKTIVEPTEEPTPEVIESDKPKPKQEKKQLVRRTKDYKAQIELVKNGERTLKDVQKEYKLSPAAIKEFKAL